MLSLTQHILTPHTKASNHEIGNTINLLHQSSCAHTTNAYTITCHSTISSQWTSRCHHINKHTHTYPWQTQDHPIATTHQPITLFNLQQECIPHGSIQLIKPSQDSSKQSGQKQGKTAWNSRLLGRTVDCLHISVDWSTLVSRLILPPIDPVAALT